ncbi:NAD(P)-binding protein [Auriscalpium vulgare]|uniref:NAD(P)-binding protein n=1 Tax=Auriscalpium vulgare TaxID=40419 RepID=A0ACB8RIC1_9AGAM|nr:NAD(P)-binding protein [Auriscalpium vulgare]
MSAALALAGKGRQKTIVTGSSRSIGASIARRLASDGASVVINYVNDAAAAESVVSAIAAEGKGKAVSVKADVSTVAGAKVLLDQSLSAFGKLDILVLNAGIMGSKVLADVDEAFYESHFAINVKGPLFLTKLAAPLIPAGGRIIFLSTSLAHASSVLPNALVYVASKGAVEQLSRVLAKDLGARGVTVNTVSPGPTDTDLFRAGKPEQVIQFIANQAPAKRLGKPEEIGPVVAFLASEGASWVNGQNILVNGGFVV